MSSSGVRYLEDGSLAPCGKTIQNRTALLQVVGHYGRLLVEAWTSEGGGEARLSSSHLTLAFYHIAKIYFLRFSKPV